MINAHSLCNNLGEFRLRLPEQFSLVRHHIFDNIFIVLRRNCIVIILFSMSIMCGHCNLINSVNHDKVG